MGAVKKGYRTELDGLRAIAVMAVIIYHAELSWRGMTLLSGGFLGVDIFFVLSGFLITGILIERSPSLYSFYKGRVDRIYPALLLMLLFTCIATYKFMQPSDLLVFVDSLKGALGFYSNYVFMYEDSYISDSSKYKALLHTWSLGIEWQYYLAFPLVVYTIKRFFPNNISHVIILLFSLSFVYCLYLMRIDSSHAFYSTFSRIWQLFAGGLVFLISRNIKKTKYDGYIAFLSLSIIIFSILFFKDTDNHPGFISFFAVIGSALFIIYTREGGIVHKLATLRLPVFIGVISYSLYLYHQPVLVFYRLGYSEVGNKSFFLLFLVMLVMAYCSYRFFENPIRMSKRKTKYIIILLLMVLVYSFANGAKSTQGYESRQSEAGKIALSHFEMLEYVRLKDKDGKGCSNRDPKDACYFDNSKPTLLAIGDSYVAVFTYALSELKNDVSLLTYDTGQCPLLSDPIWFGTRPECWEVNKKRWTELHKIERSKVLVGINFNQFYHAKASVDNYSSAIGNTKNKVESDYVYASFRRSIEKLIDLGYDPIVLLQPPTPSQEIGQATKRKVLSGKLPFQVEYFAKPTVDIDKDVINSLAGIEGVKFISLNEKLCNDNGKCMTFNENGGLYNGGSHLSYFGVNIFLDDILKAMSN